MISVTEYESLESGTALCQALTSKKSKKLYKHSADPNGMWIRRELKKAGLRTKRSVVRCSMIRDSFDPDLLCCYPEEDPAKNGPADENSETDQAKNSLGNKLYNIHRR